MASCLSLTKFNLDWVENANGSPSNTGTLNQTSSAHLKALVSGLPIGATIAKAIVMDWTGGSHASTFGGNPVSCVVETRPLA